MRLSFPVALVLSALALGAQGPTIWRISDVPPELRAKVARADLMIAALHDSVLRELADEMDSVGAAGAVGSCHIDSLLMTQRIAREGARRPHQRSFTEPDECRAGLGRRDRRCERRPACTGRAGVCR